MQPFTLMIQFILYNIITSFFLPTQSRTCGCGKEEFMEVADIKLYDWEESKSFFFFTSKMAIDADGSPRAYHPKDIGLDKLSYAGYEGNWWALATDNNASDGNPVIQGENDPYPGYYVSMTALTDRRYPDHDPRKYVDSEKIPYFVLPPYVRSRTGALLGDIGYVYNKRTKKGSYAIFADIGPEDKIGEGSIYLANQLGVPSNPRTGGQNGDIVYIVFPFSGNRQPRTIEDIQKVGAKLMEASKGFDFLKNCMQFK